MSKIMLFHRLRGIDGGGGENMWKKVVALTVALTLVLAVAASATTPRSVSVFPTLRFNGTTAECEVLVFGNTENEALFATVKLMHGDEMLRTWYPFARGIMEFVETVDVTRGEEYTLMVRVDADTASTPWLSVSGRCN